MATSHQRPRPGKAYPIARLLAPVPPLPVRSLNLKTRRRERGRRLLLSLGLSTGIGWLAYKRRSLTGDGALGAVATGTSIVGYGGWSWGLALISFFLSSTFLSHLREKKKAGIAADKFSKGSQRDIAQVAANGGVATLYAISAGIGTGESTLPREICQAGFTGALATATADTWATEVGVLSPHQPRLLTTGRPVAPGTSGGVTLLGSLAALLGALVPGLALWLTGAGKARQKRAALLFISLLSGFAGSLCDSLLGATVQAMYFCPTCRRETERRVHACGTPTHHSRGLPWCNNDVINFFATLTGSLVAIVLSTFIHLYTTSQRPIQSNNHTYF